MSAPSSQEPTGLPPTATPPTKSALIKSPFLPRKTTSLFTSPLPYPLSIFPSLTAITSPLRNVPLPKSHTCKVSVSRLTFTPRILRSTLLPRATLLRSSRSVASLAPPTRNLSAHSSILPVLLSHNRREASGRSRCLLVRVLLPGLLRARCRKYIVLRRGHRYIAHPVFPEKLVQ